MSTFHVPGNYTVLSTSNYSGGIISVSTGSDYYLMETGGKFTAKLIKSGFNLSMDQVIPSGKSFFVLPPGWSLVMTPVSGSITLVAKRISW